MPRPATIEKCAHDPFLAAIGFKALREQFGLSSQRLYHWRRFGVPADFKLEVAQMALVSGVSVPADFLKRAEKVAA